MAGSRKGCTPHTRTYTSTSPCSSASASAHRQYNIHFSSITRRVIAVLHHWITSKSVIINISCIAATSHLGESTAYRASPPSSVCTDSTVPMTSPAG